MDYPGKRKDTKSNKDAKEAEKAASPADTDFLQVQQKENGKTDSTHSAMTAYARLLEQWQKQADSRLQEIRSKIQSQDRLENARRKIEQDTGKSLAPSGNYRFNLSEEQKREIIESEQKKAETKAQPQQGVPSPLRNDIAQTREKERSLSNA